MYGCMYIHSYIKVWQIQDIIDVIMYRVGNIDALSHTVVHEV